MRHVALVDRSCELAAEWNTHKMGAWSSLEESAVDSSHLDYNVAEVTVTVVSGFPESIALRLEVDVSQL